MSDRVLSSQAAKDAITALQNIINGGLQNEINNLNQQGNQLKDPNNWDGPLAERFRNDTWPGVENTLRNLTQELTDLREQLNQISTDIFHLQYTLFTVIAHLPVLSCLITPLPH